MNAEFEMNGLARLRLLFQPLTTNGITLNTLFYARFSVFHVKGMAKWTGSRQRDFQLSKTASRSVRFWDQVRLEISVFRDSTEVRTAPPHRGALRPPTSRLQAAEPE